MNQKEIIIALRDQGMSYQDIARFANTSDDYARNVCSRANRQKQATAHESAGLCRCCGVKLIQTAGKKQKQFCSDKCRYTWKNRKNRHKPYVCVCEYCGHEFVSFGYPNKRFCSSGCRTLAGREAKTHV